MAAREPGSLVAPMPGSVVRIEAAAGQRVGAGQPVLVLEAMKMEHQIVAPADGLVAEVLVGPGDQVQAGDVLATVTGHDAAAQETASERTRHADDGREGGMELVSQESAGEVTTLTLDSPATRNALSSALLTQLRAALAGALDDPGCRVVVLTGADPAFCAGADLKESRDGRGRGTGAVPARSCS